MVLNTILLIGSFDPCGESDEFSSPVQCLLLFIEYEEQLKVITRVSSALSLSYSPSCSLSLPIIVVDDTDYIIIILGAYKEKLRSTRCPAERVFVRLRASCPA